MSNLPETKIILFTVIVGNYDSVPQFQPEAGISYWLLTDNPTLHVPEFWERKILTNPFAWTSRKLSRWPKLQPHSHLPDHQVSIYIDANLTLRKPILKFALNCIHDSPVAAHPHPKTNCLYTEAEKCIELGLDEEHCVRKQMGTYQEEGFPPHFGLTENSFMIRKNTDEVKKLNDIWWKEYCSGSQRDQLSFMYAVWRTGVKVHQIQQHARVNPYYIRREHLEPRETKEIDFNHLKRLRGPRQTAGLKELIATLPDDIEMIEVGSYAGESAAVFAASGKVKLMWCIDRWGGEEKIAETVFDQVRKKYPTIIEKIKAESERGAKYFPNQSVDFVYIDAMHDYESVKRDIMIWRPKVKAGGIIGGHDYSQKFSGVIRAVHEAFGDPEIVFKDSSWTVKVPRSRFGIVSYCSLSYLDAFEFSVDSWLDNGLVNEVVIYTDSPEFEKRAKPREKVKFICVFSPPAEELPRYPWIRKAEAIQLYFESTNFQYFVYLDCDCWINKDFREVFQQMSHTQIIGTRLLGRHKRGKGEANAGVIFFRHHPTLNEFFELWKKQMLDYREKYKEDSYDQDSLSHILIEAFDGLHPFQASLVSEHLYNCEHNEDDAWLQDIARYQPKIIHFKKRRFRNSELVKSVFSKLHPVKKSSARARDRLKSYE